MGKKKPLRLSQRLVGVVRLERTTTCTPCKYASQLRYTPIIGGCFKTTVQRYRLFDKLQIFWIVFFCFCVSFICRYVYCRCM